MKILYRLGYYLGGFSVGLIFLAFILNGKKISCNYTPNARVIDNLLQKELVIPAALSDRYPSLNKNLLKELIRTATVDFSKSDTQRDSCKRYQLEGQQPAKIVFEVANCTKKVTLITYRQP